jgi:hypothetical protein
MHDQERYLTVTTEDGQTHVYKVDKKQARKLFKEMKHDSLVNPDGVKSMERTK